MVLPPEKMSFSHPIEKHPPERRQRKKEFVVLYSCCCCCCCCLHTIGGVIGAARAGDFPSWPEPSESSEIPHTSFLTTQLMYWISLVSILFVGLIYGVFLWQDQALIAIGLSAILLGPLWLLAASLVMAIWLALRSDLPSKSEYWRQLGRITSGSIAGSVIGVLIMVAIPVFFTVLSSFLR